MFDAKRLGDNIKAYRIRNRLSQSDIADRLGVTPQSVSKWECAISVPSIDSICLLADIFNISLDELFDYRREHRKAMIGIDGGGSKTEFILFDDHWTVLQRIVLGSCNPNAIGVEASASVLREGINTLIAQEPSICGIYVGASGFGLGCNGDKVKKILQKAYPGIRLRCSNDILNVIASAMDPPHCIAAICGTGLIVFKREQEKLTRLTGWGHLLGKQGSGYDLGRDALYATLQDREGLGKHTLLSDLVESKLGCSVADAIPTIYKQDQSYIASFAPLVLQAYQQGDMISAEILQQNTDRIAEVINYALQGCNANTPIILSGGIFAGSETFAEIVCRKLICSRNVIVPKSPQVYGACVLCAKMCGVASEGSYELFTNQYYKILHPQ